MCKKGLSTFLQMEGAIQNYCLDTTVDSSFFVGRGTKVKVSKVDFVSIEDPSNSSIYLDLVRSA
jgi:hypothetical protein